MNRNRIQLAAICAFAFVLVFAAVAGAQATKVTGKWDLTTEGGRGPQTSTLMLTQDGGKLTGTMTGGRGGDVPVTGTVDGNKITLTVTRTTPNGDVTSTYTGTIDGDAMKGTVHMGQGDRDWSAMRSKS
jgi:hypothetical protein